MAFERVSNKKKRKTDSHYLGQSSWTSSSRHERIEMRWMRRVGQETGSESGGQEDKRRNRFHTRHNFDWLFLREQRGSAAPHILNYLFIQSSIILGGVIYAPWQPQKQVIRELEGAAQGLLIKWRRDSQLEFSFFSFLIGWFCRNAGKILSLLITFSLSSVKYSWHAIQINLLNIIYEIITSPPPPW